VAKAAADELALQAEKGLADKDEFGDYNDLIADLKRDAQHRRPEDRPARPSGVTEAKPSPRSPGTDRSEPRRSAEPAPVARDHGANDDFGAGL